MVINYFESAKITYNGNHGVVAEIAFREPNIVQKLNRISTVEPKLVSRHNAIAILYVRAICLAGSPKL